MQNLFNVVCHGLAAVLISARVLYAQAETPYVAPPGSYHTSWIGNSFGGSGAAANEGVGFRFNAYGHWVQDNIGAMAVSADGTVFNNVAWDEGGHAIGLYKNPGGDRVPVLALKSTVKSPHFNTAGAAICVDGDFFYVGSLGKGLLRFQWTPGNVDSAKFVDDVMLPEQPIALSCSAGKVLVGYPDKIELRDETSLQLASSYPASDLSAALLAPDGSFWVIAGDQVRHLQANGDDTGVTLPGIGKPASLAWGKAGTLIVSDDGPAQQVLFFDVSASPKLTSSFGVKGGLYSGTAGAVAPQKLFALRGAGMDAEGNLYVGMSFSSEPTGNAFIRAFSPSGSLLWENYSTAFVDTFGFEPGTDGTVVYGRTTRWQLNLDHQSPGSEASLTAITLDPLLYPGDSRIVNGYTVYPRLIKGTQLLYVNGQYGQGFDIFAGSTGTDILRQVAATPTTGREWYVTDDGDIWQGDMPGKKIALYPLQSITSGQPVYDWQQPQTWPWPADFKAISKVIYEQKTDSLYVFGFLNDQPLSTVAWGTAGLAARRYDGWLSGHPHLVWTNAALPVSVFSPGKSLPAKDVSLAGDYLFFGMIKNANPASNPIVNIINANTGQFVGMLKAGPEVGGIGGWEDMVGSVQATERANGEYLILVEDDWRAKNILFRWTP